MEKEHFRLLVIPSAARNLLSLYRPCNGMQKPDSSRVIFNPLAPSRRKNHLAFNRQFYVYILASKSRNTYVGMTNSLLIRVMQHKAGEVEFTSRYRINRLVYVEVFKYVNNCIARETQLKSWSRAKKVALIQSMNPTWEDLAANWGKPIKPLKP